LRGGSRKLLIVVPRAEIRYARSGDVNIAYQVVGEGPIDVVLVPGFISHLELDWEDPRSAHFLSRLASFSRLIRFDKRGTGLSDRPGGLPDLETRMDDVRAVLDTVGSERTVLFGYSEGGPMSILFAGTYPERTSALVLSGTYAKRRDPDDDYPWAPTWEVRQAYAAEIERDWGWEADMQRMSPSAGEAMARWWALAPVLPPARAPRATSS
jgi:pimeloyl-ACP methyl ester carboxylesterase